MSSMQVFVVALLFSKGFLLASALPNGPVVAQTPPMGWNSWNHFGCHGLNEDVIKGIADAFVSTGLKDCGYEYVNLDDCWQINRTSDGVIIPDPSKFPSGLPNLIQYVHSKGLKFGLYTDRGLYTCQHRPGAYGHEEIDAKTYASWGVEFLKNDDCNIPSGGDADRDYGRMSYYLNQTGKGIVHSVKGSEPIEKAYNVSNMRRVGHDIRDEFVSMLSLVEQSHIQGLAKYAHPGFWNDLDMLEIGNGHMTTTEYITHMSLWCLLKAPLIMGNDLRNASKDTIMVLSNKEVIAINQDSLGVQGTLIASGSAAITNNSAVVAQKCLTGNKYQMWKFDNASHTITNVGTGACLSAVAGSGPVYVEPCDSGSANQKWSMGDFNTIHPGQSKIHCLDVYNYTGPVVQLYNCKTNEHHMENQQFSFGSDGTFRPNISGLCLDLQAISYSEVWGGPLANKAYAAVLLNKGNGSLNITLQWSDLGLPKASSYKVRDLWQHKDMGTFSGSYTASDVPSHGVAMILLTPA
ncbi:uncharacterized protein [Oscarella lobularis]|uniref:uncharacterized protein n=1 Tax=Oscarella lobularis TaxID=121494 RepID=UPI003313BCD3